MTRSKSEYTGATDKGWVDPATQTLLAFAFAIEPNNCLGRRSALSTWRSIRASTVVSA